MKVRIRAFAKYRELFGDQFQVEVEQPATVLSVIQAVGERREGGFPELLEEDGSIKKSVIILVNRQRLSFRGRETHPVRDDDEVAIYPPVAGG